MSTVTTSFPDTGAAWHLPSRGKVAMAGLIIAESAIFTIFVVAYLFYLGKSITGPTPSEVLETPIFYTICLLSSSLTIHLAAKSLERDYTRLFLGLWLLTIALGGLFLYGTAQEWHRLISGATLSRFFALHVFVIPGLLIGFVGLHVLMVLKLGINEWPMPGRIVRRATYEAEYHALTKNDGEPFVPYAVWKDMFFAAFIILAVAACAYYFGPFGPTGQPDPIIIQTAPKPDYFFLWLYALLSLLPPSLETPFLLIVPPVVIIGLILLPFLSGEGEKSWRRRPIAVVTVLLIAVTLGTFTRMAQFTPWSPHMNAWSGDPVPERYIHSTTALERQGALVFQVKQCRNCHSIGDTGGQRGPALDTVAVRLTQDQLIRQVIQGGGNMPAYGNNLSPAETTALVAFLETLHPATQGPARDAARELVLSNGRLPASGTQP